MAYEKIKEILQAIESEACSVIDDLLEAAAAMTTIKNAANEAIGLSPPQDVADVLQAIKVIACETYTSMMAANMALQGIKGSAAIAITMLGK